MKFRTKIWMLPLAAAGVFIVGLSSAIVVGHSTQTTLAHLQNVDNPYLESMLRVGRDAEQLRMTLQSAASEGDPGKLDELKPLQADAVKALDTAAALEGKADSAQALRQAFNGWHEAALAATKAMLDKQDFSALLPTMQAKQAEFEKQLAAQEAAARDAQAQSFTAAARGVNRNQWLSGLTGLVVLLVLGITSHRVIVSVWRDIGSEPMELASAVRRVAEGDLNVHIPVHPKDTRSLSASFAAMTRKLSETVHTIREATDSITTASSEIASGNLDLSARTEQTASSLQSTAGSIEQLTGSVQQSAEVANTANSLAQQAVHAASRGNEIVGDVVHSMQEISEASRKISDIIGVIDGIAFQTNILALNAAVEAARAGEQGRGFAVVAGEVRTLAQRSANAAREIKTLIHASSEKVESGSRLVQSAGSAMQEISADVEKVTRMIGDITHATQEQSSGIGLINQSVASLDGATQQNAALVEQASAAAESLKIQAQRLSGAVAIFRLAQHA